MADKTKITWTDATWSPITGCSVISAGCKNCYAMRLAGTRLKHHPSRIALTTMTKNGPVWTGQVRFNDQWLLQPLHWTRSRRIFVCAHSDLFHKNVPDEWIDQIFAVMALSQQHTFQVLTKRTERMYNYLVKKDRAEIIGWTASRIAEELNRGDLYHIGSDLVHGYTGYAASIEGQPTAPRPHTPLWPLPNVHLIASVEDQKSFDERILQLLDSPAVIRGISAEPLLGPLNLSVEYFVQRFGRGYPFPVLLEEQRTKLIDLLDWVIVGGESGPHARPMHPAWVRSIRDQCAKAGVPFLLKQWGEWVPQVGAIDALPDDPEISRYKWAEWTKGKWKYWDYPSWDDDLDPHNSVTKVGKTCAGRMLDDVLHDAYPEVIK